MAISRLPLAGRFLADLPLCHVPVLYSGPATTLEELVALIGPSRYKSPDWHQRLVESAQSRGIDTARAIEETDPSDLMEGLYIKVEEGDRVIERLKYVRSSFLTVVKDSGTHWLRRPIVPNGLADGVDLFGVRT